MKYSFAFVFLLSFLLSHAYNPTDYVDPKIGSMGLGRTYIGPTMPYGMIKPSPDGEDMPNSGWSPMPTPIRGFSQTHVSGTGGGQKYGNILLMPTVGNCDAPWSIVDKRTEETIELGYYATKLENSVVGVEITSANRASIYNFTYPKGKNAKLIVDAAFFLGTSPIPDLRETQQFVGSQIEIVSDTEVRGYNRVRGGWNNGRAYTVYFWLETDKPFLSFETWKDTQLSASNWQSDTHAPTGAVLDFGTKAESVKVKIGISFLSELKAKENLTAEIPGWDFDGTRATLIGEWGKLLGKIELDENTPEDYKTMFYTGLYHAMIMPTDRSGENPLWADDNPYYDDFYAIWDTYRTSLPMITLIDEHREVELVNSLINIYVRDGYMPDARSGNSNGRTQGGSNAEIVIADAFVKGLEGIDYELALEAMIKDAEVAPGGLAEAEGRGGLHEYNTLGYVPFGIPRAGNRTVEYSYCDYAIATVAAGLGKEDIAQKYLERSGNWKNLWCDEYEHAGVKGFIMPRDAEGNWLEELPFGHSVVNKPTYKYDAMTFEGPWYMPWWSMFFYEAPSWEYSLSIPHDVDGLIEKCGGAEAFDHRLDVFFDSCFYNVNNEPSFLSPCLYHWIGKPHKSSDRVRKIIADHFNSTEMGLPGNDDSGAMSSWLAFHMLGLYPVAGQDFYLINSPLVETSTMHFSNGKDLKIVAENFSEGNPHVILIEFNGEKWPSYFIDHKTLMNGGELKLKMGKTETAEHKSYVKPDIIRPEGVSVGKYKFTFYLHGQKRRYQTEFFLMPNGNISMLWGIERNLAWQEGTFETTSKALESATKLCFLMPIDRQQLVLSHDETTYILPKNAFKSLKEDGRCKFNFGDYMLQDIADGMLHAIDQKEGAEIWVLDDIDFPLIMKMKNNQLEIDWDVTILP